VKIWYRKISTSSRYNGWMNGTPPKLVIFDFDGTLADTLPFTLSIMDELSEKFGTHRLDRNEIPLLRSYSPAKIIKMYNIPLWKLPLMTRESQRLLCNNIESISLFEGIDRVIREIAGRGIKLAVVSSNALHNITTVLGEELCRLFSIYECQSGLLGKAPRLRKALRLAGVKPGEALSIGDEIRDIEAARKAGIPCAAVTWGFADSDALSGYQPNHLVKDVSQLLEIIG
jgi:phosphoglycolate phosphatase